MTSGARTAGTRGARRLRAKLLLAVTSTVVSLAVVIGANHLVGAMTETPMFPLLFRPLSVVEYATTEFRFTARINRPGFRDREFGRDKPAGRTRILAIGDSFTYGWGVAVEASWPKLVERNLRAQGLDVEVANLGRPGAGPPDYVRTATVARELLKPGLVLVGILQGNDFEPLLEAGREPASRPATFTLIGNLSFAVPEPVPASQVREAWREQVRDFLRDRSPAEREAYRSISPAVRDLFEAGELAPWRLRQVLDRLVGRGPRLDLETNRALVTERLAASLRTMREAVRPSQLVVVSVPAAGPEMQAARRRAFGLPAAPEAGVGGVHDEIVRDAAAAAGLEAVPASGGDFRAEGTDLFFLLDAHLSAAGHRLLAERVTPGLVRILRGDRGRANRPG